MSKRFRLIPWILCILFIAAQTVIAAFYTVPDTASVGYLKDASQVAYAGGFVFTSPLMSLWGLLCRLFHVSVLTFALHVLPFVLIPACYGAYVFAILSLPDARDRGGWMLFVVCMLHLFGYQADAFSPFTLLLGWYTGYALILHLIAPLLLGVMIRVALSRKEETEQDLTAAGPEDEDMKHKYLNVRNLAIVFVLFAVLAAAALFVLNRKINNLHAATENLQRSIAEKGDLIEFRGKKGDVLKGYVLNGSDGGVSVVFGGDEEDGPALAELLGGLGNRVDSWYVKEGEDGALNYCRKQGIAVSHVYVLEGMRELP
ncbi:MAG: hypothetical protein J5518_05045 [Lachnospiraceae bacterium]|nr:hypothetical protein [Lachnospiraceae bacterium]